MSQVVIGDILPYTQATAILNQTVFGTNWTANAASDVVVYQTPSGDSPNDVTQILTYPADYSVAFIGGSEEVQVTLSVGAAAGDIITITRQTPADRENLYSNTNFLPSMLNNDFGILTLVDQQAQLVDQKVGPRYNYSAVITNVVDTILPILGANQVWGKNNSNTAIVPIDISSSGSLSGIINPGTSNQVAYYAANGNTLSGATLQPGLSISGGNLYVGAANNIPLNSGKGLVDSSGNFYLNFADAASAVNYLTLGNNSTGNAIYFTASGSDTNITFQIAGKGTGGVAVHGTGTNDDASAGYVGEVKSSQIANASAVSLVDTTSKSITSISLTAGDWDVYGNVFFNIGGNCTSIVSAISTVNNTLPDFSLISQIQVAAITNSSGLVAPTQRFSVSGSTTVYLIANSSFSTSTVTASGLIYARRVR